MSSTLFEQVKASLQGRLDTVIPELLPGGTIHGREYVCASLQGGPGSSCSTNLDTGIGSDFATGESWKDVIDLWAKIRGIRQGEAARELAERYGVRLDVAAPQKPNSLTPSAFMPIMPVPATAPDPLHNHPQHGTASALWRYANMQGQTLCYTARFDLSDGSKVILPLCYGQNGMGRHPQWNWKALPEPRPLYGLPKLAAMPDAPVLLVEGEKTADAAQVYFPDYAALTWGGGANATDKVDLSPLANKQVIIWPDNDEPGFKAALGLAERLEGEAVSVRIVQPPDTLPEKWDLADPTAPGFIPQVHLATALSVAEFHRKALARYSALAPVSLGGNEEQEELALTEWPKFSFDACPGIVGEFVRLATRDSEADPAAVCVTMLTRFAAEVYGYAEGKGPHMFIGETLHMPRLFAVICGNSSKARKGTSLSPVSKLFTREYCLASEVRELKLSLPARESGGPLSTGEGLACQVKDETEEERQRRQKMNPNEPVRDMGDKRLMIQDEEFASGLACTKREGNTLSMGLRCFWDSGDYAPLTKNNPVRVKNAHICIITHITMQELAVALADVQAFNGFGNRFLWICARRSKLVPLPSRMPVESIAPLQNELWRLVAQAQQCSLVTMSAGTREQWESVYSELSKEHGGLAGSIINRAEAQTMRLALIYTLLDGQSVIQKRHLKSALALWRYAQESALYIFGGKAADPLEEKILEALKQGPLTATELSAVFCRHIPKDRLQPLLQQMEARQRISITKQKSGGRPKLIITLSDIRERSVLSEKRENGEISAQSEAGDGYSA